jgi:phosphate starvation-inducible PhoH-like protein
MSHKRRNNRKQNYRQISEEIASYNDENEKEKIKNLLKNYHYLSYKEKNTLDQQFSKPKNMSQFKYLNALNDKNNKIIIATGPAGTGKTLFGTEYGLKYFCMGQFEKIIFTRPAVSADEDLGYLPGTLEEKMTPWVRPIYDILYRFISPSELTNLLEEKHIEIAPLAYMRGRTFKNTWIIADEMQNATPSQMKMLLTRLGEGSHMVITGDLDQHDRIGEVNGLQDFLDKFKGKRSSSITSIEFDKKDIEREEVIKEILDIYAGVVPLTYIEDIMPYDNGSEKDNSEDNI